MNTQHIQTQALLVKWVPQSWFSTEVGAWEPKESQKKQTSCAYHYFFFFFCFLGQHPRHVEVPRLGVESELQLLAYTAATAGSNVGSNATSVTYTTAHGNNVSVTHRARPGIKRTSSWTLVWFASAVPWQERPAYEYFKQNLREIVDVSPLAALKK